MNKQRASAGANRPQTVATDFDDWETNPDYIRDMDEMDQRWGSKRTVGSIDMNDLIEQVNREHKIMSEKSTKRIIKEEKSSASSSKDNIDSVPQAYKSIKDKIDAFKKEFDDIESNVARRSNLSKVIKKSTNFETKLQSSGSESFVSRNKDQATRSSPISSKYNYDNNGRSSSATPTKGTDHFPRADIKGLSRQFESLYRESDEDFKRRTEARRKEFFDQIRNQVRETRKNLDGFDPIDDHSEFGKPKVYTRSETTKEEIVSKLVKEGDKVIENETKRNVERSSSCHGSSDEEATEPTMIKQELSRSPTGQYRTKSPIDEIKRTVPVVESNVKGAGLMARTLYDYQAAENDELTFDVDELITNIEKVSEDWYNGTITRARRKYVGLFPANYVKLLNDSGEY